LFADELNAAIANAGAPGGAENVIGHGADPTGVADSTTAFRAALATGNDVFIPKGNYVIIGQLTMATGVRAQALRGAGRGTVLLIDTRFDSTVTTGVLVLTGTGDVNDKPPEVSGLTFKFAQPIDLIKSATATSAAGTNTVTINNATGVVIGMAVVDAWARAAITNPVYLNGPLVTVSAVAGNVVTLSANIAAPGVTIGDSIQFASVRSMYKTLANNPTVGPGGTGVRYPWAIYNSTGQTTVLRDLMFIDSWNGIYIRGSGFHISQIYMSAFNIGLDIDQCFNFPSISDYRFWLWGFYGNVGATKDVTGAVYYDGQTVAANFGETDGVGIYDFQTWSGIVNLTTAWTWGSFTNLMLDGDNSNLNVLSTNGNGFVQIANGYSSKGAFSTGTPVVVNAGPGFHAKVTNFDMGVVRPGNGILVQGGTLQLSNSYLWDGIQGAIPMIAVSGGALYLSDTLLDASGSRTDTYISVTGTGALRMRDCDFVQAPGAGANGVAAGAGNSVSLADVSWNGWRVNLPAGANNWLPVSPSYANDAAAAAGGVPIGGEYRNGSAKMVRVA
jgi:hypothetical protein